MEIEEIISKIIAAAYEVQRHMQPGYLEAAYRKAMMIELRLNGVKAKEEEPLPLFYKGEAISTYRADLFVEDVIIVELKAIEALTTAHEVQLVNYLNTTGKDIGLLINFGRYPLELRRKYRLYRPGKKVNASLPYAVKTCSPK